MSFLARERFAFREESLGDTSFRSILKQSQSKTSPAQSFCLGDPNLSLKMARISTMLGVEAMLKGADGGVPAASSSTQQEKNELDGGSELVLLSLLSSV